MTTLSPAHAIETTSPTAGRMSSSRLVRNAPPSLSGCGNTPGWPAADAISCSQSCPSTMRYHHFQRQSASRSTRGPTLPCNPTASALYGHPPKEPSPCQLTGYTNAPHSITCSRKAEPPARPMDGCRWKVPIQYNMTLAQQKPTHGFRSRFGRSRECPREEGTAKRVGRTVSAIGKENERANEKDRHYSEPSRKLAIATMGRCKGRRRRLGVKREIPPAWASLAWPEWWPLFALDRCQPSAL